MEHVLLTDILLLLAASIPIVVLLRKIRLPSLAGFLVAGVLLGPHALGWIHAREEVEGMAEIGVALLLFTVGLEFSIARMLLLRKALFLGGGLQILGTIALVGGSAWALGLEPRMAVLFAFLAATSSTAVVLKIFADEGQIETPHGQFSVAVLLFQDLAVIPLLLLLPMVAGESGGGMGTFAIAMGKAVLGVGAILLVARYGFSRVATIVVRAGGRELFTLFIVLVALGAAWVTQALGLPLALGAFVAGLVISESEYSHQVVDEILPFRDVFNALFFVSVGMLLDASILLREPVVVLGLCLFVSIVKGVIVFALAWWLRGSRRVGFLAGAALFQVGEFSFVLAQQAGTLGVLAGADEQRFLAVAVLTMMITPFVIHGAHVWVERRPLGSSGDGEDAGGGGERTLVLVAGYGITGKNLSKVLVATAIRHRVMEMNPDVVRESKNGDVEIHLGDSSRADTLMHAGIREVRVFVVAINDPEATRRSVKLARRLAPGVQIVVRTRFLKDTEELLRLGANQVVPEDFETSLEIFSRVLRDLHVPASMVAIQTEIIRREGYQLMRGPVPDTRHLQVLGEVLANMAVDTLYVSPNSSSCGRSLGELNFRARSGATVLSAVRREQEIHGPGADFVLEPGDLLLVRGNHDQLDSARELIAGNVDANAAARNP